MQTRQVIITILAVLLVVGSVGIKIALTNAKKAPERVSGEKSVKTVWSYSPEVDSVHTFINITGKLVAAERIDLFAEVNGKLLTQSTAFKEGNHFKKGEVLLQMDGNDFGMNLKAQKSSFLSTLSQILPDIKLDFPESYPAWQAYLDAYNINGSLNDLPEPANSKEKYFLAGRNIYGLFYSLKSLESTYNKYTIRAPFDGVVSSSLIDQGTNIRAGQPLGSFINSSAYELETAVSIKDLAFVKVGDVVHLQSDIVKVPFKGKIKRISQKIDPATQTVRVFVEVTGSATREGMYLSGGIASSWIPNATVIPRRLILGDTAVFVVLDSLLALKPISIVRFDEGNAIITGLSKTDQLLSDMIPGAYNGMTVKAIQN